MASFAPPPEPKSPLGRLRILSPTAGLRMSPLQLGAMSFGDAWSKNLGDMDKASTFKMLDAFYENGGVSIDTANNYQDDQSEKWVGEWIKSKGIRDELVIATKYTSGYKIYDIGANRATNASGNSKKSMRISLEDSLKKMQLDYIDIFYLHWWDYTTPIKEIMDALNVLVESGKVLYLGISDTPAWIVAAANQYAVDHGKTPFVIYQGKWSVLVRDFERDILPMAREFGMALAPWGASGSGRLQSKKQMEARKASGEGIRPRGPQDLSPVEEKMSLVLAGIAEKHGLESVTSVALAYVMAKAPYVFPIIGGRKVEHLLQNIECLTLKLTPEEIKEIEDVQSFDVGFPHDFIGGDPRIDGVARSIIMAQCGTIDFVRHSSAL